MQRNKNKYKIDIGMEDFYRYYRTISKSPISRSKFSKIIKKFNSFVSDQIIYDSFEFKFPARLGHLRIRKRLVKPKMVDGKFFLNHMGVNYKKTLELWKKEYPGKSMKELKSIKNKPLVMHNNKHSDGYKFKWYWNKSTCNIKNHSAYKFRPTRSNTRALAAAIFNGNVNYYK